MQPLRCGFHLAATLVAMFSAAPVEAADATHAPSLREKLGQLLLVGFRGTEATANSHAVREVVRQGVGGVLLYERDGETRTRPRNIASPQQVRRLVAGLQAKSRVPLFVAIDQEGGLVTRFKPAAGFAALPSAKAQGRLSDDSLAFLVRRSATELAENGVNLNFAPVVDLDVDTASKAVGALQRSFGPDTATVIRSARIFCKTQRDAGVLSTLKHFPGQGSGRGDTHEGFVDVTTTWADSELVPFSVMIREGRADMVMTTHVVDRRLDSVQPASLSRAVVDGLLRRKLSYRGVVVTDDLQMEAVRAHCGFEESLALAMEAGSDILLLGNSTRHPYDSSLATKALDAMEHLVASGRISSARIDSSWRRVMELKRRLPPPLAGVPMRILWVRASGDPATGDRTLAGVVVDEFTRSRNSSDDAVRLDSLLGLRPDAVLVRTDSVATWVKQRVDARYEAARPVILVAASVKNVASDAGMVVLGEVRFAPVSGQNPGRVLDVVEALREAIASKL